MLEMITHWPNSWGTGTHKKLNGHTTTAEFCQATLVPFSTSFTPQLPPFPNPSLTPVVPPLDQAPSRLGAWDTSWL